MRTSSDREEALLAIDRAFARLRREPVAVDADRTLDEVVALSLHADARDADRHRMARACVEHALRARRPVATAICALSVLAPSEDAHVEAIARCIRVAAEVGHVEGLRCLIPRLLEDRTGCEALAHALADDLLRAILIRQLDDVVDVLRDASLLTLHRILPCEVLARAVAARRASS